MIGGDGVNCASCVTFGVVENRALPALVGGVAARHRIMVFISSCEPVFFGWVLLGSLKIALSFLASQHLDIGGLGLSEQIHISTPNHGSTFPTRCNLEEKGRHSH
jgi:hypothetical protein